MAYVPWFNDKFLGIPFPTLKDSQKTSGWKIKEKIVENSHQDDIYDLTSDNYVTSEADGTFICSRGREDDNSYEEAIMKIWMQIPHSETRCPEKNKQLRDPLSWRRSLGKCEVEALNTLTTRRFSSTPKLLAWTRSIQRGPDVWVPDGYLIYILMSKLPGEPIRDPNHIPMAEYKLLIASFKQAWIECYELGIINLDMGSRNLLWDNKARKCYIVDFADWATPSDGVREWHDGLISTWVLKRDLDREDSD